MHNSPPPPDNRFWGKLAHGTLWSYFSTYGSKAIVFLSTVVLARLLLKEDFGVAGYALVVISFLVVLHDFGIGTAIIYYDLTDDRKNTAFWLNLGVGVLLCGVAWLIAPLAGIYFGDERAIEVTRLLGFNFPLAALGNIHDALLRKEISFDKKFMPDMTKSVTKAMIAIGLALAGFGYWSLLIGHLAGTVVWVVLLWVVVPWRPALVWSQREIAPLFAYGSGIAFINLLAIVVLNIDYLFIGRYLGPVALGVYTIAFRLPELVIQEFPNLIGNVLLPAFAQIKKEGDRLNENLLTILRYSAMITMPVGLGLGLVAGPLTLLLYSDKWGDAVPVMEAIAVQMAILSLSFNLGTVYKANGQNHVLIRIILVRIVILVPALWWAVTGPGTLLAIAQVHVAVAIFIVLLDFAVATRVLNLSLHLLLRAVFPAVLCSAIMFGAGLLLSRTVLTDVSPLFALISLVPLCATLYIGLISRFEQEMFSLASSKLWATISPISNSNGN